jgi:hypothetical protein
MPDALDPYRRASAQSSPSIPPGVPRSYAITVPDSWALIPLEHGVREKAITALIRRQFADVPGAAGVKAALRRHLTDLAEAAWQTGGIEFYLSLMKVGPMPIPASLLVTLIPPPPSGPLPVEAMAAEAKKRDRSARLIVAVAGTAVRAQTSATDLSFYFPVPGSGAWLLLAFSGPDGPLSPVLGELFDAIAATLRWAAGLSACTGLVTIKNEIAEPPGPRAATSTGAEAERRPA